MVTRGVRTAIVGAGYMGGLHARVMGFCTVELAGAGVGHETLRHIFTALATDAPFVVTPEDAATGESAPTSPSARRARRAPAPHGRPLRAGRPRPTRRCKRGV